MKKNLSLPFLPARLVKSTDRWFITFNQTNLQGKRIRIKQTFDINRIKDLEQREHIANQIVTRLNTLLPHGYPYLIDYNGNAIYKVHPVLGPVVLPEKRVEAKRNKLEKTKIIDAIRFAERIKCQSDRIETINNYRSHARLFIDWLLKENLNEITIIEFDANFAGEYLDYLITKARIKNVTYNNKLRAIKGFFQVLLHRKYITENPFDGFKTKRSTKKQRRTFNQHEKKIVATYIKEHHKWLYYGLMLQYYCFIRPAELRRLRFNNFDLVTGVINIQAEQAKNHKSKPVTIPDIILPDFLDPFFSGNPLNYFVFGSKLRPHPTKSCSKNYMNLEHGQILKRLQKLGKLGDINGLTWYSWKDTGATDLAPIIPRRHLQEQMRHATSDTTERYLHPQKVLTSIKELKERQV